MITSTLLSSAKSGESWRRIMIRSIIAKVTGYSFFMWISHMNPKSGRSNFVTKFSLSLIFLLGLIVVSSVNAEVYRWIDAEGNIHFGDCPPTSCESVKVDIAPAPSDQQVEEAQERFKHFEEYQYKLRESRKAKQNRASGPVTSSPPDAECFSSLTGAWSGKIPDSRDEVKRRPLTNTELRRFENLFQTIKGRRRGSMVDIHCISPEATPPSESYRYDLYLDSRWEADQLFKIDAELDSEDSKGNLRQLVFWILLSRDGLRFSEAMTDTIFEIDRLQYDVETLTSGKNTVMFFLRRGGTLRRTNVFLLHRAGPGFTISEFFYVQGILAEKRYWTIKK